MSNKKCPCGSPFGPRTDCDMCDDYAHDPDTGWGGYTNHFKGKHYNSKEEEELEDKQNSVFGDSDSSEDDETWSNPYYD